MRVWVLASFVDPPAIWMYKETYVDLASQPFTSELRPESHITNLLQVHHIVGAIFRALLASPTSLPNRADTSGRFRRLGLDFLVDESSTVWLIEVNVLRNEYGLGCPNGSGGDVKRNLVRKLVEDEVTLRASVAGRGLAPDTFEDLSNLVTS